MVITYSTIEGSNNIKDVDLYYETVLGFGLYALGLHKCKVQNLLHVFYVMKFKPLYKIRINLADILFILPA